MNETMTLTAVVLLLSLHYSLRAAQEADGAEGRRKPAPRSSVGSLRGARHVPNSFFATTTHFNSAFLVELLEDLNMHTVRVEFMHRLLEPTLGRYAFASDNPVIRSADLGVSHGLDQLALVNYPADWVQVPGPGGLFPNDQSVKAFEEFVYRIAKRYEGKIRYWQAGNEPYMETWKGRYVTLLKALHAGVKRADPENRVVLSGFSGGAYKHDSREPEFLDMVYQYGGKDHFDIVASHPYTWPLLLEEGRYLKTIKAMHEVMERNGDRKPLWVTEVG